MLACFTWFLINIVFVVSVALSFRDKDNFSTSSQLTITNMINDFRAYPNELMWKKVYDLNDKNHPLIFFHQRKAGGTSIREVLYQVSKRNKLSNYIVCYSERFKCDVYELPVNQLYSIYGGHFYWNSLRNLNRFHPKNGSQFSFSCVTNFREPISRLKSCLHYRFLDDIKRINSHHLTNGTTSKARRQPPVSTCLANVPVDQLETMINQLDNFGNSCLDEPFRVLSGFYDPDLMEYGSNFTESDMLTALRLTIDHLKLCTPLVLEIPGSYHLANAIFPQIDGAFQPEHLFGRTAAKDTKLCAAVNYSKESELLFERYTVLERALYRAVYDKVYQATLDFKNGTLPLA